MPELIGDKPDKLSRKGLLVEPEILAVLLIDYSKRKILSCETLVTEKTLQLDFSDKRGTMKIFELVEKDLLHFLAERE